MYPFHFERLYILHTMEIFPRIAPFSFALAVGKYCNFLPFVRSSSCIHRTCNAVVREANNSANWTWSSWSFERESNRLRIQAFPSLSLRECRFGSIYSPPRSFPALSPLPQLPQFSEKAFCTISTEENASFSLGLFLGRGRKRNNIFPAFLSFRPISLFFPRRSSKYFHILYVRFS